MSTIPNVPTIGQVMFRSEGAFSFLTLLADGHDVTSRLGTLASGAGLVYRGTVVYINSTTGAVSLTPTDTPQVVGSANGVVAENVDATSQAASVLVYLTGRMKADAIIWPAAGNHANLTECLRDVGIYIESVLGTVGTFVKSTPLEADTQKAKEHLEEAKKRLSGETKEGEKPDLVGHIADSQWSYMTVEERMHQSQLAEPPVEAPPPLQHGAAPPLGPNDPRLAGHPQPPMTTVPPGTAPIKPTNEEIGKQHEPPQGHEPPTKNPPKK